jgi:hypothetical protein
VGGSMRRTSAGLAIVAVAIWATPALAASSVTVEWTRITPRSGTVAADGWLQIDTTAGGTFPLAVIERPAVGAAGFAIEGDVSFSGVEGRGYLEMWIVFPEGARYFSRTLATTGPQAALSGSSSARPFALPFDSTGPAPSRLEVNLVLPAAGTVRIGPLQLVGTSEVIRARWWSDRAAGLGGGIGGSAIGVMGALLGVLVARGKARRFVLGSMLTLMTVGGAALVAGVVALLRSQPFGVAYPLLLGGALLIGIFGPGYRAARRAFADNELRRIRALDLTAR